MATQNKMAITSTIQAGEDLSGHQYQGIALDDQLLAVDGWDAGGIILNKPKDNEHVIFGVVGEFKFLCGPAVGAGDRLAITTSGYFIGADSGYYSVGRAKLAVTSGSIGTGFFDFSNPQFEVASHA